MRGQHFLKNKSKLRKIVEALDLKSGDTVIEIGPGHGELTQEIRNEKLDIRIIAIEKDPRLVAWNLKHEALTNVEIVEGDALKILPQLCSMLHASSFKIVGNIPYYITGYLFRILGELENKPEVIVLTIQKEVAERVCARPPKMNLLAASIQFWAEPKIIGYISKHDFKPQPKVDSAILKLKMRDEKLSPCGRCPEGTEMRDNYYYELIKIVFKQPRKTILNNLVEADLRGLERGSTRINKEELMGILFSIGINPNDRPQNLSVEHLMDLVQSL